MVQPLEGQMYSLSAKNGDSDRYQLNWSSVNNKKLNVYSWYHSCGSSVEFVFCFCVIMVAGDNKAKEVMIAVFPDEFVQLLVGVSGV